MITIQELRELRAQLRIVSTEETRDRMQPGVLDVSEQISALIERETRLENERNEA